MQPDAAGTEVVLKRRLQEARLRGVELDKLLNATEMEFKIKVAELEEALEKQADEHTQATNKQKLEVAMEVAKRERAKQRIRELEQEVRSLQDKVEVCVAVSTRLTQHADTSRRAWTSCWSGIRQHSSASWSHNGPSPVPYK